MAILEIVKIMKNVKVHKMFSFPSPAWERNNTRSPASNEKERLKSVTDIN